MTTVIIIKSLVVVFHQLSSLTQTVELLKQDKQYLERQLAESKQRCHTVMERNEHLRKQLEEAKMEKEKALHQLVHSKLVVYF